MDREKDMQSAEIAQQVADYLARGGRIDQVDHTANKSYREPLRRTRKQQVQWARENLKGRKQKGVDSH